MNFLDANGDGVITKKDLKALKKAGYLEGISASQAYKQLDANRDGVVDPYEAARLFGGQAGALPGYHSFQPNPYQGYMGGMPQYVAPPGLGAFQAMPGVNPINGLTNFQPLTGGINAVNGMANYPGFGDFSGAYNHNVGVAGSYGFGY